MNVLAAVCCPPKGCDCLFLLFFTHFRHALFLNFFTRSVFVSLWSWATLLWMWADTMNRWKSVDSLFFCVSVVEAATRLFRSVLTFSHFVKLWDWKVGNLNASRFFCIYHARKKVVFRKICIQTSSFFLAFIVVVAFFFSSFLHFSSALNFHREISTFHPWHIFLGIGFHRILTDFQCALLFLLRNTVA